MAPIQINATLPSLPSGWTAEKDFKSVSGVSASQNRAIEPVGPHFLAHARRKRHQRTFSEDERIQAANTAKKVETEDDGEISEAEDPMMLQREGLTQLVYKHAVSTIQPARPLNLYDDEQGDGEGEG